MKQPLKLVPVPTGIQPISVTPSEETKAPILLECLYGKHKAELFHRGTAYCRACYDERNRTGTLIN